MDKILIVEKCRLCESKNLKKVIVLSKNPIGDRFFRDKQKALECELHNVEVMFCEDCGQMQLSEVVEPGEIYTEEYLYSTTTSVGLSEHFKESAKSIIERFKLKKDSFVVELGSNEGAMLEIFKEEGMRVLGIDPANMAVEKAKQRGVETICGFFTLELAKEIVKQKGKANNVIANNVIANIPLLKDVICGIKELLSDDGVFVFETSYAYSVIQKHLIDTIYHEHISYFTAMALARLFESCGLELFDAEEIWTKGGSLRGYVGKPRRFAKTEWLKNIIKNEHSFIFASHIVANTRSLNILFEEIKKLMGDKDEFIFESFYAKKVLENNLLDMVFHEHLNYLYLLPLCEFLENKDLNLYDAKLIDSKGGSIQISITKDKNRQKADRLMELMESEKEFFANKDKIFVNFQKNLEFFRNKIEALGKEIKERNGKLIVYGASVGGVMMVYHLGLSHLIDCFVDDNVAKIGAFCPNLGVPVLDSKILENGEIKEVISVAWRFMEPITKKHKKFLEDGGKFYSLDLASLEIKEYGSKK